MFNSKIFKITVGLCLAAVTVSSCYKDKEDLLLLQIPDCENSSINAGAKFTAVRSIISSQCATSSCHSPSGGQSPDLSTNCSIIERWNAINIECVIDQSMPMSGPLSTTDQQAITDWINAGHKYTD